MIPRRVYVKIQVPSCTKKPCLKWLLCFCTKWSPLCEVVFVLNGLCTKWLDTQNSSFVANFPNFKGPGPSPKVLKKNTVILIYMVQIKLTAGFIPHVYMKSNFVFYFTSLSLSSIVLHKFYAIWRLSFEQITTALWKFYESFYLLRVLILMYFWQMCAE